MGFTDKSISKDWIRGNLHEIFLFSLLLMRKMLILYYSERKGSSFSLVRSFRGRTCAWSSPPLTIVWRSITILVASGETGFFVFSIRPLSFLFVHYVCLISILIVKEYSIRFPCLLSRWKSPFLTLLRSDFLSRFEGGVTGEVGSSFLSFLSRRDLFSVAAASSLEVPPPPGSFLFLGISAMHFKV